MALQIRPLFIKTEILITPWIMAFNKGTLSFLHEFILIVPSRVNSSNLIFAFSPKFFGTNLKQKKSVKRVYVWAPKVDRQNYLLQVPISQPHPNP